MGDLSEHYSRVEFRCPHCLVAKVSARLAPALERLRAKGRELGRYPRGMRIVSGYRCPSHNAAVHGAAGSKHLTGEAADLDPVMTLAEVLALKAFKGIGWKWLDLDDGRGRQQYVVHVDVGSRRGATVDRPATWEYLADGTRR